MYALLNKHGYEYGYSLPDGLKELMSDISREVIKNQPQRIFDFIANYLSCLLITRENSMIAVSLIEDLCDCRPTLSEHLLYVGIERHHAIEIAKIINHEIIHSTPPAGAETEDAKEIMSKVLTTHYVNKKHSKHVKRIIESTYRMYWYRKKALEQIEVFPNEPWGVAAERTITLYKKTNPTFAELSRATAKIQAAYLAYHKSKELLSNYKAHIIKHPESKEVHYNTECAESESLETVNEPENFIETFVNENKKSMVLKAPTPSQPHRGLLDDESSEETVASKPNLDRRNTSIIFGPFSGEPSSASAFFIND